jgi:NAD(P)-dependent dehydrogenase (short-subunit alcohol dehydrogenase family)
MSSPPILPRNVIVTGGLGVLGRSVGAVLAARGINVNAVLPSILDMPANRAAMPDADASRWVSTASLGAVIAFLLSDDALAVTGACLPVAGRV